MSGTLIYGIELDEIFSYSIEVDGDMLMVTISQDGEQLAYREVDMADSGYDNSSDFMYFKAGIYLNDKTSDDDDTAKVSFYVLENDHENYDDESNLM
ncbi:polysaccharide lyase family 7 protein [Reinekea marinisedimentorum]|uniref:polysaccharide lyase family 7 protein n=1 Tax=Reinekea marinisedimentorum TaxID=230495 RepID=UPI001A9CCFD7|nr:polysaccharide lyase family 7 protein [Reinekea marinisedimentorum]